MAKALVFDGSSQRLESEILVKRNSALHFKAPPGGTRFALYGPYVALQPGRYRFELQASVEEAGDRDVHIQLCVNKANLILYSRRCFRWEISARRIRVSFPFETPVEDLEVRLRVPGGSSGTIDCLLISQVD